MNTNYPFPYQPGGSLKENNPTYVLRNADRELYDSLKAGKFCYVFNSRQMGKSSLRVQVRRQLEAENIRCASINLDTIGSYDITPKEWYGAIIYDLHDIFNLDDVVELDSWSDKHSHLPPVQKLKLYLEKVLLVHIASERIVIFIDEIDSVLNFSFDASDFFALIRACYNLRVDNPAYERLNFVLLGVATPAGLIQDLNKTPFNIGEGIELEVLKFEKSGILAEGLVEKAENPQEVLKEILYWTGGQPFLTQKLCKLVQEDKGGIVPTGAEKTRVEQLVQFYLIDNWQSNDDPVHFRTIENRFFADKKQRSGRLLGVYQQILQEGSITYDGSSDQMELQLTGSVLKRGDKLEVYNPIYQRVFSLAWAEQKLGNLRDSDDYYAEAIKAWLAADKQDNSLLLRGQSLQKAQKWAKSKRLSDEDYQFINASQELGKLETEIQLAAEKKEREATEKSKEILALANKKANQRIRIGLVVLAVSLIASVTAWGAAFIAQNKEAQARTETIKLESQIQQKNQELIEASEERVKAEQKRDNALNRQIVAEKQTLGAKKDRDKAEKDRQQAQTDLVKAEQELQTAVDRVKVAQVDLGELQQERQSIEQQLGIAQKKLGQAEQERQVALVGTKLEQQGTSILQRFRAGTQSQIDLLLEAMEVGQDLYQFTRDGRELSKYPATSPLHTLHAVLQGIKEKNTFKGHQDAVYGVAFSPDGKYIASGSKDGTARLWDLQGNLITEFKGHQRGVPSVAFSPDGKYIATGSGDKTARLWNLNGNLITEFKGHQGGVYSVAFSPDGKYIATGSGDKTARLWNLSGNLITEFKGHQGSITSVAISLDGKYLATGSGDKTARLWNLSGNLIAEFKGHQDLITSVIISPNGRYLATGSEDMTARLWNLNGNLITEFKTPRSSVSVIDFSGDSKYLFTGSFDGTAQIWDVEGNLIDEFKWYRGTLTAALSPDQKYLAIGSVDRMVRLIVFPRQFLTFATHHNMVNSVAFSPDGYYIATAGGLDEVARLWNAKGKLIAEFKGNQKLLEITFSPDGKYLATWSMMGETARLWDITGKLITEFKGNQNSHLIGTSFSPDGKYLAAVFSDGTAQSWDLKGSLHGKIKMNGADIVSVSFSPDGKYLATGFSDGTGRLWDVKGKLIAEFKGHKNAVFSIAFSPNSQYIATASGDGTARLWDLNGNVVAEFKGYQNDVFRDTFFLFDNKGVITQDHKKLLDINKSHGYQNAINSITFSPDGTYLATGASDGIVRLWDIKGNLISEFIFRFRINKYMPVKGVVFSPDGKYLAAGSNNGIVQLWKVKRLPDLLASGCLWLKDYLASHPDDPKTQKVREICKNR